MTKTNKTISRLFLYLTIAIGIILTVYVLTSRQSLFHEGKKDSVISIPSLSIDSTRSLVNGALEDNKSEPLIMEQSTPAIIEEDYQSNRHYNYEETVIENNNSKINAQNNTNITNLDTIILRKNVVGGINILNQAMINHPNTIYVILYDYMIDTDLLMPAGCILKFNGGSLSAKGKSGLIKGSNTSIIANKSTIFNNIALAGTWEVAEAYPEWLGAKGDGITDDRDAINKTLNAFNNVILDGASTYSIIGYKDDIYSFLHIGINVPSNIIVDGRGATIKCSTKYPTRSYSLMSIVEKEKVVIKNINFIGDAGTHAIEHNEWGIGIHVLSSDNVKIEGCTFKECISDGVYIGEHPSLNKHNSSNVTVSDCVIDDYGRNGISISSVVGANINNCKLGTAIGNWAVIGPWSCIDIEADYHNACLTNISIKDCTFSNKRNKANFNVVYNIDYPCPSSVTISNCTGNGIFGVKAGNEDKNAFNHTLTISNCSFSKFNYSSVVPIQTDVSNCKIYASNDNVAIGIIRCPKGSNLRIKDCIIDLQGATLGHTDGNSILYFTDSNLPELYSGINIDGVVIRNGKIKNRVLSVPDGSSNLFDSTCRINNVIVKCPILKPVKFASTKQEIAIGVKVESPYVLSNGETIQCGFLKNISFSGNDRPVIVLSKGDISEGDVTITNNGIVDILLAIKDNIVFYRNGKQPEFDPFNRVTISVNSAAVLSYNSQTNTIYMKDIHE